MREVVGYKANNDPQELRFTKSTINVSLEERPRNNATKYCMMAIDGDKSAVAMSKVSLLDADGFTSDADCKIRSLNHLNGSITTA